MFKVFVYGTLKPDETNFSHYCAGKVVNATKAYTHGRLYHLQERGYPAMIRGDERVDGYLLIFVDDAVLLDLDFLEDYQASRISQENEYQRERIMVYFDGKCSCEEAWIYLMSSQKIKALGGVYLPSGYWDSALFRSTEA